MSTLEESPKTADKPAKEPPAEQKTDARDGSPPDKAKEQADSTKALQRDSNFQFADRPIESPQASTAQQAAQEKQLAQISLQRNLSTVPIEILATGPDGKTKDKAALDEFQKKLKAEEKEGKFGPASQEAFQKYTSWLENTACKATLLQLDSLKLPFPTNAPQFKSETADKLGLGNDLSAVARRTDITLNLGIKTDAEPGPNELKQIEAINHWISSGQSEIRNAIVEKQDKDLNKLIKDMHLPAGWDNEHNPDTARWRQDAQKAVDLVARTRNYIEAMDSLSKAARNHDFDVSLPPGATITRDKDDNIAKIDLNLPKDLNASSLASSTRLAEMEKWLKDNGDKVNQALVEYYRGSKLEPHKVLSWEDREIHGMKGRFDKNGQFAGLAAEGATAQDGETIRDMNLMRQRFDVRKDGDEIVVSQTVSGVDVPWWGYQNLITNDDGRQPMAINERRYKPNDNVLVKTGENYELVKAKDLESYKAQRQFLHYGEKTLVGVMDAAMVATATVELGALYRGARLTEVAAETAARGTAALTREEITKEGLKAGIRFTAGLSGIINNAGARDSELGNNLNHARQIYFLADISKGLFQQGMNLVRDVPQAVGSAEKLQVAIKGGTINGEEILASSAWISKPYEIGHYAFKGTEFGYMPIIGKDLAHIYTEVTETNYDHLESALQAAGDGRGMRKAKDGDFDNKKEPVLQAAKELLTEYERNLAAGKSDAVAKEIKDILDETKNALAPETSADKRQALIEKLASQEFFSPEQIKQLEESANSDITFDTSFKHLSPEQLSTLYKQAKGQISSEGADKGLLTKAQDMLKNQDADISAARKIALLYLSRDNNGKLLEATQHITIPAYSLKYKNEDGFEQDLNVAASNLEVKVSAQDQVEQLKLNLINTAADNVRNLVTGDVLTRVGAISHKEYGAVLTDLLKSDNIPAKTKLDALSSPHGARLISIVDGIQKEEAAEAAKAAAEGRRPELSHLGAASRDFIAALESVASNPKENQDVRALASFATLAFNDTSLANRKAMFDAMSAAKERRASAPEGSLAKDLVLTLEARVNASLSDGGLPKAGSKVVQPEVKLNATHCLELIADKKDEKTQRLINESYANCLQSNSEAVRNAALNHLLFKPEATEDAKGKIVSAESRLHSLQASSPELADKARQTILNQLKSDLNQDRRPLDNRANARLADLIRTLPEIMIDASAAQKQQCKEIAEKCLTEKSKANGDAAYSDILRVASIQTLAEINSRDSVNVIRQMIGKDGILDVQGQQLRQMEKSPSVRATALAALESLKDPLLNDILNAAKIKETDRAVIRQIENLSARNIPLSQKEFDASKAEAIKAMENPFSKAEYANLAEFGELSQIEWMNAKFPALDGTKYEQELKATAEKAMGSVNRAFSFEGTEIGAEMDSVAPLIAARKQQWDNLCKLALENSPEGNKAKAVLNGIVTRNGHPLASSGTGVIRGTKASFLDFNAGDSWQNQAARALGKCTETGRGGRDLACYYVKEHLSSNLGLNQGSRLNLLRSWTTNMAPAKPLEFVSNKNANVSEEEYFKVLNDAMLLEKRRSPDIKSKKFEAELRKSIDARPNQKIQPLLQAVDLVDDLNKKK